MTVMVVQKTHDKSNSWWAYNSQNQAVLAKSATNADRPFFCHCPHKHPMHLSKPSGKDDKRPFTPYFAHNPQEYKARGEVPCYERRGESKAHMYAKTLLQKHVGSYSIVLSVCEDCKMPLQLLTTSKQPIS